MTRKADRTANRLDHRRPAPNGDAPRGVFVAFAIVFTPCWFLAVSVAREAYGEWGMIEARGKVVEARIVRDDRPSPRSAGPWSKEWLVAYGEFGEVGRAWFPIRRYRNESDAETVGDVGQTKRIWYDPDTPNEAMDDEPKPHTKALTSLYMAFFGTCGLLSLYALIRRRGSGRV